MLKSWLTRSTESSVMLKSLAKKEVMEEILQHITDEGEISSFHQWIGELCNPDSKLVQNSNEKFELILDQNPMTSTSPVLLGKEATLVETEGQKLMKKLANKYNCYGDKIVNGHFRIRGAKNDFVFEGNVDKNCIPHGFVRVMAPSGGVEFYGCFISGHLVGNCWRNLAGGSFLVSDSCDFGGKNTVYFYPDCRTVLVGEFANGGQLKSGQVTEVIGVDKDSALNPDPVYLGPDPDGPIYEFDESSKGCISKSPMLADPYEELFVYLDKSHFPEAGQGLFARIPIEPSTVVSFYNGIKYGLDDPDAIEDSCYKVTFDDNTDLDIPPEMTSSSKYIASLGHKVSHSFTPNCEFDNFIHPRFGLIKCLVSLKPICQGEELTVHYEYELSMAPSWYKKLWAKHQKSMRGIPNWKMALAFKGGLSHRQLRSHCNININSSGSSSRSTSECVSNSDVILEEDEDTDA